MPRVCLIFLFQNKSQNTLLFLAIVLPGSKDYSCGVTPRENNSEFKDIINTKSCLCQPGCDFIDGRCIEGVQL